MSVYWRGTAIGRGPPCLPGTGNLPCVRISPAGPVIAATLLSILTACGSSDSTVAITPDASHTGPVSSSAAPAEAPPATPEPDPCPTNLAAPAIARAVSELPRDPRSGQAWNPEPIAGNYNECAQLSAVVVRANTNAANPNTRAVLFHQGKFVSSGAPDTFGFNGIDEAQSTGDTVALTYSSGIPGLSSVVKFRWNGSGVELVANTP